MADEVTAADQALVDNSAPETNTTALGVGNPVSMQPVTVPMVTFTTGNPSLTVGSTVQVAPADEAQTQIKALREEAAKWRTQLRTAQDQIKELSTQAAGNQDLTARLATLEASLANEAAKADKATKEATLLRLAVKAGVDPDVAALLDLSKLNLDDEAEAVKQLAKLAPPKSAGTQVKPAQGSNGSYTTQDEAAMRTRFFGGPGGVTLFGG